MKKLMYIAAALLVLVGCNKKDGNSVNGDEPNQIVRLSAKIEIPQGSNAGAPNKVVAVGDVSTIDDGGTISFVWEEGDQVLLVNEGGSSIFTMESGAGDDEGTFVGEALADMSSYIVYYPAVASEDNIVLTYDPEGKLRPMGYGEGNATSFLINSYNSVISIQLIGQNKVSKIVYQAAGQPSDKITTTTLNFDTDDILELNQTTASAVIYLPLNKVSETGFSLTFYDENNKAFFEQTTGKDMSELGVNRMFAFPITDISRWVDMGFAGIWARYNVGTLAPEKSGDYFAWGETKPYYNTPITNPISWKTGKENGYSWQSYAGFTNSVSINEWNPAPYDVSFVLKPEYDAATQHADWGSDWCTPTQNDWNNLQNTTYYTWTWYDGTSKQYNSTSVGGFLVTNKESGKSIFIPAAGASLNDKISDINNGGNYWTSNLLDKELEKGYYSAYCFSFSMYGGMPDLEFPRYGGMNIRPIHK